MSKSNHYTYWEKKLFNDYRFKLFVKESYNFIKQAFKTHNISIYCPYRHRVVNYGKNLLRPRNCGPLFPSKTQEGGKISSWTKTASNTPLKTVGKNAFPFKIKCIIWCYTYEATFVWISATTGCNSKGFLFLIAPFSLISMDYSRIFRNKAFTFK